MLAVAALAMGCSSKPAHRGAAGPASDGTGGPLPALRSVDGRFVDAEGRVVVLHGLNMVAKQPPYAPDALGFGFASPHPLAVAGTPSPWTFDPSTATFTLRYTSAHLGGGGTFPAGSTTAISTPHVVYPHGYSVRVTGAHVASAPNANRLVLASDTGATAVTVTVEATSGDS